MILLGVPISCTGIDGKRIKFPCPTRMVTPEGIDYRPKAGTFPMAGAKCWNHMTPEQQELLSRDGIIDRSPGGLGYGGGTCPNKATVAVQIGNTYGKRFYCAECAAQHNQPNTKLLLQEAK